MLYQTIKVDERPSKMRSTKPPTANQCVNVTPPSQEGEGSSIATRGTGLYRVLPKLYNKRLCSVNQFE